MYFIAGIFCNFQVIEQRCRVISHTIIGAKHLRGIRFAKTPGATDTTEFISFANGLIDHSNEARFVDICVISFNAEYFIARIDVDAHIVLLRNHKP